VVWIARAVPHRPAHSAAWHVGPEIGVLASWDTPELVVGAEAMSASFRSAATLVASVSASAGTSEGAFCVCRNASSRVPVAKKWGAPSEHPFEALPKNYRFFAAFFFAPLAAFFAIVLSLEFATQPPTAARPSQRVG